MGHVTIYRCYQAYPFDFADWIILQVLRNGVNVRIDGMSPVAARFEGQHLWMHRNRQSQFVDISVSHDQVHSFGICFLQRDEISQYMQVSVTPITSVSAIHKSALVVQDKVAPGISVHHFGMVNILVPEVQVTFDVCAITKLGAIQAVEFLEHVLHCH